MRVQTYSRHVSIIMGFWLLCAAQGAFAQNTASEWFKQGLSAPSVDAKIRALEKAIQLDPNYTEAFYFLGLAYKSDNQLNKAEVALNKAYFKNPYALNKEIKTRILYELGDIYKRLGKTEEAIEAFIGALELTPSNPIQGRIHLELGELFLAHGDVRKAIETLRTGRSLLPQNSEDFERLIREAQSRQNISDSYQEGVQALAAGQHSRALSLFDEVTTVDPDFKDVQAKRDQALQALNQSNRDRELLKLYEDASAHVREGRTEQAILALERLVALDPLYKDADSQLQRLRSQSAPPQPSQVQAEPDSRETLYKHGRRALNRGDWQKAIHSLTELQRLDPAYKDVPGLLKEAEAGLESQKRPDNLAQLKREGDLALNENDGHLAQEKFEQVRAMDSTDNTVLLKLEHIERAVDDERGTSANGHYPVAMDSLYEAGVFAIQNSDWEEAVAVLTQVAAHDSTFRDVQNRLADAKFHLLKNDPATQQNRAVDSANSMVMIASMISVIFVPVVGLLLVFPPARARLLIIQGKHEKAISIYQRLLKKNPGKIRYYPLLASLYIHLDRRDEEALQTFQMILRMNIHTEHRAAINSIMASHYVNRQSSDPDAIETLERELDTRTNRQSSGEK